VATGRTRDALGGLLAAIAAEVMQRAAGAEAEIMAWYAAGVAHAMRYTSRPALASVLRSLRAERSARLAAVRRNAEAERQARRRATLLNRTEERGGLKTLMLN
jgi:hypothetical protein